MHDIEWRQIVSPQPADSRFVSRQTQAGGRSEDARGTNRQAKSINTGKMEFIDAVNIYQEQIYSDGSLKPTSKATVNDDFLHFEDLAKRQPRRYPQD